jgi:hypothetical protein
MERLEPANILRNQQVAATPAWPAVGVPRGGWSVRRAKPRNPRANNSVHPNQIQDAAAGGIRVRTAVVVKGDTKSLAFTPLGAVASAPQGSAAERCPHVGDARV